MSMLPNDTLFTAREPEFLPCETFIMHSRNAIAQMNHNHHQDEKTRPVALDSKSINVLSLSWELHVYHAVEHHPHVSNFECHNTFRELYWYAPSP